MKPTRQRSAVKMTAGEPADPDAFPVTGQDFAAMDDQKQPIYFPRAHQQQQRQQHLEAIRQMQLGKKDLIIRMLAEIFQVKQDAAGQIRWQQVSSSLVPISLYSRTTSRWLDYLLKASTAIQTNDPENTMSPDSRDFLLLLQKYHQSRPSSRTNLKFNQSLINTDSLDQRQEYIVFQVVGHDFIDGQCRKILNIKIKQPGSRLGQASNYFVYWKDQSNTNQARQPVHIAQPQSRKTGQMLNLSYFDAYSADRHGQASEQQTWGLNFASINDAKLFFDICSLNIVDLDFNSEYLKQLSLTERQRDSTRKVPMTKLSPFLSKPNQSALRRRYFCQDGEFLDLHHQDPVNPNLLRRYHKQELLSLNQYQQEHLFSRQSSLSRCPSCKQAFDSGRKQTLRGDINNLIKQGCPMHSQQQVRSRSRSTTRQPGVELQGLTRVRSFSTPASPENGSCPVHPQANLANVDWKLEKENVANQRMQIHHKNERNKLNEAPVKPARGFLRSTYCPRVRRNCTIEQQYKQQYELDSLNYPTSDRLQSFQSRGKIRSCMDPAEQYHASQGTSNVDQALQNNKVSRVSALEEQLFLQKMPTGPHTFDTIAHRDARQARAMYANSKNLKEFLSLDGGGLQSMTLTRNQYNRKRLTNNELKKRGQSTEVSTSKQGALVDSLSKSNEKCSLIRNQSQPDDGRQASSDVLKDNRETSNDANNYPKRNNISPKQANLIQCNVSTTTADLPLDNTTRKRMMKLTSEEIISERTEPKSSSVCSTFKPSKPNESSKRPRKISYDGKFEMQMKDSEMNIEWDCDNEIKFRGRKTRSDTGRRRSLERSGCVDLDSNIPGIVYKKQARLSPLSQASSSPIAAENDGCFLKSSLCSGSKKDPYKVTNPEIFRSNDDRHTIDCYSFQSQEQSEMNQPLNNLEAYRNLQYEQGKDLIVNSRLINGGPVTVSDRHRLKSGKTHRICDIQLKTPFERQLTSFKSAPDMRRLINEQEDHSVHLGSSYNHERTRGGCNDESVQTTNLEHYHPMNACKTIKPLNRPNMSSYAVPLCTTIKRPPQQATDRQFHSCPNSLRRKRRSSATGHNVGDMNHDIEESFSPAQSEDYCSCQYCLKYPARCSHRYGSDQNEEVPLQQHARHCFTENYVDCLDCDSIYGNILVHKRELRSKYGRRQSHLTCRYQCFHNNHHYHHDKLRSQSKLCNDPRRFAKHAQQTSTRQNNQMGEESFNQRMSGQTPRPYSSRSNQSAMQYGLYESDCDDDNERLAHFGESAEYHTDELWEQFEPQSDDITMSPKKIKPFQGYDQTMARAFMKSRQRSKSQPPTGTSEGGSAVHLTKSMENVEKLIREVQNELRTLKKRPWGVAQFDMRTAVCEENQAVRRVFADVQNGSKREMSQEEKAKHALQDETNGTQKLSCTSATRRAGQFKCAGAIRKAGFLSVKKWILKRRQSIELARKQGWKRYWVCLRGATLLFHSIIEKTDDEADQVLDEEKHKEAENQTNLLSWIQANCSGQLNMLSRLLQNDNGQEHFSQEALFKTMSQYYIEQEPKHLIIIDGAVVQPVPEHPRRDFVFCLSTTFGDAYLFQASCQPESDNWISAIHNACAASIARDLVYDEAVKLFESKIKHFELEAEKKLFLRHRLDSRLISMSSMCNIGKPAEIAESIDPDMQQTEKSKTTLRSLLHQLNQQLLALDFFIEQLHCEIYQLRCYISSCNAQNMFYQNNAHGQSLALSINQVNDLPHPKSLLMHVSKPTKLLLIKLGVFTVSSFHAYIHARQESAKNILQTIEQQTSCSESPIVELRIRSQSISQNLISRNENKQLENQTETLIEMTNFKKISIMLQKSLFYSIRNQHRSKHELRCDTSDDRFSIKECDDYLILNMKLNPHSNSSSIIKQVLKIIEPNSRDLDFLSYYLRLLVQTERENGDGVVKKREYVTVKRKETLEDLTDYIHIEFLEKALFRVELVRSRIDEVETASPFGISIEGQLMSNQSESFLNVYCSYIEWGSVADKEGLQDEDEFLMINGLAVAELDLMFLECIIQDATKLRAVVRSSRCECPTRATRIDQTWRSLDDDGAGTGDGEKDNYYGVDAFQQNNIHDRQSFISANSQVISDEYITSLVCPPPPTKSNAFLRPETNFLRRKSDLGAEKSKTCLKADENICDIDQSKSFGQVLQKSSSQHQMNTDMFCDTVREQSSTKDSSQSKLDVGSADVKRHSTQRTGRLASLIGEDLVQEGDKVSLNVQISSNSCNSIVEPNHIARLKKSILELVETEYAYIRHLDTIQEHYMSPLGETSFLDIADLKVFNQNVLSLLKFQHEFFSQLTKSISDGCRFESDEFKEREKGTHDDSELFDCIVQQIDSYCSIEALRPVLSSIADTFSLEADKFRIYAVYCVSYSKLQKILHPRSASNAATFQSSTIITSIPNSLNNFSSSLSITNKSGFGNFSTQQRDIKLSSFMGSSKVNDDRAMQFKQLTEFFSNLDSSSSSASFSLQKSSVSDQRQRSQANYSDKVISKASTSGGSSDQIEQVSDGNTNSIFQKSVHQQNFESYLIKPIQRIVKYPMLLSSIAIAAQAQIDELLYNMLQATIKKMETVITHVNDTQRVHDEYGLIFEQVEKQFFEQQVGDPNRNTVATLFGPHQPPITSNIAQLLYFGSVDWLNLNEFTSKLKKTINLNSMVFVFESCVIFLCKEQIKISRKKLPSRNAPENISSNQALQPTNSTKKFQWPMASVTNSGCNEQVQEIVRYQTLIPVSDVQVRSVQEDNMQQALLKKAQFKWELFQCSSSNSNSSLLTKPLSKQQVRKNTTGKVYQLSSPTNEERSAYLRKIRFIIRESVRNMSLPTSTCNKSLVSKKFSTSSASSANSNTNINTSTSLSPPESSGGPELLTQDQSTTIKCEPYSTKQMHKSGVEVKT